jgi:hypothetical protein
VIYFLEILWIISNNSGLSQILFEDINLSCRQLFVDTYLSLNPQINTWNTRNKLFLQHHRHINDYPKGISQINTVDKTLYEILPPCVNMNTNSKEDTSRWADRIYGLLVEGNARLVVVHGDEQTVALLWSMITQEPDEYMWLLPFPGEFHLLIHVTHAIYRLFSPFLLYVANALSRQNISVDFPSEFWYKQEDFLMLVIESIGKWIERLRDFDNTISAAQQLKLMEHNYLSYYLFYFYYHFGLFYWNLRNSIRKGDIVEVQYAWKYSWPLFYVTNKYQYTKLCMIAVYLENFTNPNVRTILQHRLCNLKGEKGHSIAADMLCEKVLSRHI